MARAAWRLCQVDSSVGQLRSFLQLMIALICVAVSPPSEDSPPAVPESLTLPVLSFLKLDWGSLFFFNADRARSVLSVFVPFLF